MSVNAAKTRCPSDHEYDEGNTLVTKQGHRQCRQCKRDRATARRRAAGLRERGVSTTCKKGLHELTPENTGWNRQCRACQKASILARLYGTSSKELSSLESEQEGRCGGCRRILDGYHIVDHDHETGKVRGLLCMNCNLALGHARDDIEVLEGLIAYLRKAGTR